MAGQKVIKCFNIEIVHSHHKDLIAALSSILLPTAKSS